MNFKKISCLVLATIILASSQPAQAKPKISFDKGVAIALAAGTTVCIVLFAIYNLISQKQKNIIAPNPSNNAFNTNPTPRNQNDRHRRLTFRDPNGDITTNSGRVIGHKSDNHNNESDETELIQFAQELSQIDHLMDLENTTDEIEQPDQSTYDPAAHDGVRAPVSAVRQVLANNGNFQLLSDAQRAQAERVNAENKRLAAIDAARFQTEQERTEREALEEKALQAALTASQAEIQSQAVQTADEQSDEEVPLSRDPIQLREEARQARLKHFAHQTATAS